MQIVALIEDLFRSPPIPYEPARHSLKAWAKYCLQNRGFKVVYAQNADFALEVKGEEKYYVKVTDQPPEPGLDRCLWLIFNPTDRSVQVQLENSKQ